MRIILALMLVALLAGCGSPTLRGNAPIRLDAADSESMRRCELPLELPPGDMTQRQIEKYWGLDRKHQIECAKRHGILVDYIIDRDGGLTSK